MDIKIVKTESPKTMPEEDKLGFGRYFTDHMFRMEYDPDKGWHDARIIPFENVSLHPSTLPARHCITALKFLRD